MSEDTETRLKRLKIRSWRRGIREMDMILGPFCDECAAGLDPEMLNTYEAMLSENDQDLYAWVSGREDPPEELAELLGIVRAHAAQTHAALR